MAKAISERFGPKVVFPAEITTFSVWNKAQFVQISDILVNKNYNHNTIFCVRKNNEMPVVVDLSGNITTNKKHVFKVQVYVQKIVTVRQNLELHPTENVIFTTEVLSE